MTETEQRIRRAMTSADGAPPAFDEVYEAARARLVASRRRKQSAIGLAAVLALVAVLVPWQSPQSPGLVSEEELLGTTSWSAPSDVLLPSRETDIFYELPALPGSTEPAGGTLL
ncbi:MAG: hypothetical protein QNJ19_07700 [Woeseiaceae bacterium]|nr:hypothetical protein [Woeseiaceae bacterium]